MIVSELIQKLQSLIQNAEVRLMGWLDIGNGETDAVEDYTITGIHDGLFKKEEKDMVSIEFIRNEHDAATL